MLQVLDRRHGLPVTYRDWPHYRKAVKPKKPKRLLLVRQMMGGFLIDIYWPAARPPRSVWDYWKYAQTLDQETEIGLKNRGHHVHRELKTSHQLVTDVGE